MKQFVRLILYRFQPFFRTDMTYIARGGFWLSLRSVMTGLIAFLLAIAFANLVLPETYGIYRFLLSLSGIISAFALTGLGTAATRAIAQGHSGIL